MGWGAAEAAVPLPPAAIRHPSLQEICIPPPVLSPKSSQLRKASRTLSNAYCFLTIMPSARADVTASSRLPGGVGVTGPGALPPPLAAPAVGTGGAEEGNRWLTT